MIPPNNIIPIFFVQVEIKRAETRDKNNTADFTAAPWNQNPMSMGVRRLINNRYLVIRFGIIKSRFLFFLN